ncbi:MAG: tetratricopeptide repeat protein [Planctomycetota bacterium]
MNRGNSCTRLGLIALACLLAGCAAGDARGPYMPGDTTARDPDRARALTQQAASVAAKDPEAAEALLREALTADLYHGPAHNNLGALFLERGDLYDAATEFEWARKLMPGHPDPRKNLGLTLERAGRVDDAILAYESALEAYPGHIGSIQGLTRAQLRFDRADDRTGEFLREIALRGESDAWRDWAKQQLALGRDNI